MPNNSQYSVTPTQVTVDYLLKRPQVLQRRFSESINSQGFLAEALLQGGYNVEGGAIAYNRTENFLPDEEGGRRSYEIIAEGARFPIIGPLEITEEVTRAQKHGLRMFVTEEMVRRNQLPQLDRRLRELKNELIVYVDAQFMSKFVNDPGILANSTAASNGTWEAAAAYDASTPPRLKYNVLRDIEIAKNKMFNLRKGLNPDTLLVHTDLRLELLTHPMVSAMLDKSESSQPFFTGQLPNKLAGLDVLYSPYVPKTKAYVLQRKSFGGYGDEVPTSLMGPTRDEETETFWFKGKRVMALFIDAPEAVQTITGVLPA